MLLKHRAMWSARVWLKHCNTFWQIYKSEARTMKEYNPLYSMYVTFRWRKSFASDVQGRENMIINLKSFSNRV